MFFIQISIIKPTFPFSILLSSHSPLSMFVWEGNQERVERWEFKREIKEREKKVINYIIGEVFLFCNPSLDET